MKSAILVFSLFLITPFTGNSQCYPDPAEPCWVEKNTWFFENFSASEELPWERFRETYIGVAPDRSSSFGNFDFLFYDLIYTKELFLEGHCFGMCLLAAKLEKYGGELGFCHPPYVYPMGPNGPLQPELERVIQILHGYQLNHGFVAHIIDVFTSGQMHNGNYAYDQVEHYLSKEDPVILSVTSSLDPGDGGHSVLAYATDDVPGNKKRIYVYDTNRSYYLPGRGGVEWYTADSNWVEIDELSGNWSFVMSNDEEYQGDLTNGETGMLIATPLSIAGVRDRLPQSLFVDVAEAKNKLVVLNGDADLSQIRTADGKRYFDPTTGLPDRNSQTGIISVLPLIPLNGGQKLSKNENRVYIVRSDADIEIDINSNGGAFEAGVMGTKGFARIKASKVYGTECFRFFKLNRSNPGVEIVNLARPKHVQVELMVVQGDEMPPHVYELDQMSFPKPGSSKIQVSTSGNLLEINSQKEGFKASARFYEFGTEASAQPSKLIRLDNRKHVSVRLNGFGNNALSKTERRAVFKE